MVGCEIPRPQLTSNGWCENKDAQEKNEEKPLRVDWVVPALETKM